MDTAATRPVTVEAPGAALSGDLGLPAGARGLVLFAHGSGSSRLSPRNRQVAARLRAAGLGTLLFDLLTQEEGRVDDVTRALRFDIPLLGRRLVGALDWVRGEPATAAFALGCFGASTGAAAALVAAAARPDLVGAVVSRGGRPDLAGDDLPAVRCPTLLVVGGFDQTVLRLNEQALARLGSAEKRLVVVEGATHLFEEPGTLDAAADLAADFFVRWLR